MIQILYKVCPAAYATLTGKGNKLVIVTLIRFMDNTQTRVRGMEFGFGFVMECLQINYYNARGAKRSDHISRAAMTI